MNLIKIRNHFCILLLSLLMVYCSSWSQKKPPVASPQNIKDQLKAAKKLHTEGETQMALSNLHEIAREAPSSDSADDAYMLIGKSHYERREYEKAYRAYLSIIKSDTHSPMEVEAYTGAAKSLDRLGRHDESLSLVNRGLQNGNISDKATVELIEIRAGLFSQLGDQMEALENYIILSEEHPEENKRTVYETKSINIVEAHLNIKEVISVTQEYKFKPIHPHANLRAAIHYYEQKEFSEAEPHLKSIPEDSGHLYEQAQNLLKQITDRKKVHKDTIGAIFSLTGKHSRYARKSLQGLQLSLGVFNTTSRTPFKLAVVDSGNSPDTARKAVERLVTEDHVIAIVGGLLSKTATAISSKANELGVPNITLSQKPGLTKVGAYVFRNALTSEMLVRQLVKDAMVQRGLKRFAILYPNDPYGTEYANLFWDEVRARGGVIAASQPYNSKETDFNNVVRRLIGTFYLEDRKDEYKIKLKEWMKNRRSLSLRSPPPDDLLEPIISFDGIFLPDNTRAVGQVAPMLVYHDVKNIPLLGTNLWNTDSLIKRGQKYVEKALFVDGLSISNERFKNSEFFREYQKTFGENPGTFASQAYDAGLLLRKIIDSGESSRMGLRKQLAQIGQFEGSLGLLKMNNQREFKRPIINLEVVNGQIQSNYMNDSTH